MIRESGNLNPGQLKRRALSEMHIRFGSSWFHSEPGFQAVKKAFFEAPELFAGGEVIWKTRNKAVRKVTLPAEYGGITLAFKDYAGIKPLRYALRCSKTALEAANYRAFTALGIPMATLLFAGDDRRNFRLNRSFLATRFAEGYVDGREFLPGGSLRGTPEQKEFIDRNLVYVAGLHSIHCFHKAVRVFNFLWKPLGDGKIDIVWIDVASCRFLSVPGCVFRKYMVKDLAMFFRDLELPRSCAMRSKTTGNTTRTVRSPATGSSKRSGPKRPGRAEIRIRSTVYSSSCIPSQAMTRRPPKRFTSSGWGGTAAWEK